MAAPVLIGYDGSAHAVAALEAACRLFGDAELRVVTTWHSIRENAGMARAGLPDDVIDGAIDNIDRGAADHAARTAEEGAERAQQAGRQAAGEAVEATGPSWRALAEAADRLDAAVIVVGTRGRSALASSLLGSVSSGLVHHSGRPVLVVRAPEPPG